MSVLADAARDEWMTSGPQPCILREIDGDSASSTTMEPWYSSRAHRRGTARRPPRLPVFRPPQLTPRHARRTKSRMGGLPTPRLQPIPRGARPVGTRCADEERRDRLALL